MISLIVPIYNAQAFLPRCLDSIMNQIHRDFECILIDDGSTDNSYSICQSYAKTDNRVKLFHKENGGVASARNLGLAYATGDYVCWIDADDYVAPSYLSDLARSLSLDPDLVIQSHIRKSGNTEDKVIGASMGSYYLSDKNQCQFFFNSIQLDHIGVSVAKLFKRSIIQECNIRYSPVIRLAEDLDFLLRYLCHVDKVVVSEFANYYYVLRSESVSTSIYDFSVEQCGINQLDSSWREVYNRFPIPQIWKLRGIEIANYLHRLILSCYKPGIKRKQRMELLEGIPEDMIDVYGNYGPRSTFFLRMVNYLFVHHYYRMLDMILYYVYRIKYPLR